MSVAGWLARRWGLGGEGLGLRCPNGVLYCSVLYCIIPRARGAALYVVLGLDDGPAVLWRRASLLMMSRGISRVAATQQAATRNPQATSNAPFYRWTCR